MTIMAARAPGKSQVQHAVGSCSYESGTEKLTSSTLKRNPKMEFSKTDLLKLLSILEGELEAREVVIAVLKAEQVKQLLYPNKRTGHINDPWAALHRDVFGGYDPAFDEASVKALYGMQLRQLESLIVQQKKAQSKLREQLRDARQRYARAVAELEEEKRKHAQDTAQGDDVTYLLEKERERLRQEVEFERQQNRRLEKDLKKVTQTLEQERARQKQIVLLLLTERKQLIMRLLEERHRSEELVQYLDDEKGKFADMVEGLEEESKRSLQMEAEMERQLRDFEVEREQYKVQIMTLETQSQELLLEIEKLRDELDNLRKTYGESVERAPVNLGEGVRSTIVTMASTPGAMRVIPTVSVAVSPPRGMARAVSPKSVVAPATPNKPPGLGSQVGPKVSSPGAVVIPPKPTLSTGSAPHTVGRLSPASVTSPVSFSSASATSTIAPTPPPKAVKLVKPHVSSPRSVSPSQSENPTLDGSGGDAAKSQPSSGGGTYHNVPYVVTTMDPHTVERPVPLLPASVSTSEGPRMPHAIPPKMVPTSTPGKIGHHVQGTTSSPVGGPSQVALAARKIQTAGRGTPPPVPPNKPVLAPQALQRKELGIRPPVPPRTELHIDTTHLPADMKPQRLPSPGSRGQSLLKERSTDGVQHSPSPQQGAVQNQVGAGSFQEPSNTSPSPMNNSENNVVATPNAATENGNIDMLGQELADFQQLLVSMVQNKH